MLLSISQPEVGAPKTNRASKKGKKSWRKNVDMKEVNAHLEEALHEERVGGRFADRPDSMLFVIETKASTTQVARDRRNPKPLRCYANLEGLPGVRDPKPRRNRTRLPEERENPVVRKMKQEKIKAGVFSSTVVERKEYRKRHLEQKEATKVERATRRRMEFDFDIWAADDKTPLPSAEWVGEAAMIHTAKGKGKYMPKAVKNRSFTTGTLLPAVEVPDGGASYNPSAQEHQDLLWKAAMVELEKEKEQARTERQTTAMFPARGQEPTQRDYLQEMSEGIVELSGAEKKEEGNEEKEEEDKDEEEGEGGKMLKPKTRKQKRDKRGRMFVEQRVEREKERRREEAEVMRAKSLKKELTKEEERTKESQARREQEKVQKMMGPIQMSAHKYEPQELEVKLSDELTGNLRNLAPEGSLLEDRFKSMQRRNMIEVRVKTRTVKKLKRKTFEKRDHRMGWEENKNIVAKKIRQEAKARGRAKNAKVKKAKVAAR